MDNEARRGLGYAGVTCDMTKGGYWAEEKVSTPMEQVCRSMIPGNVEQC